MATITEVKSRRIKNEHDVQVTNSIVLVGGSITATLLFSSSMFHFWNDHHEHISQKETWWKCLIKLMRRIPTQLKVKGHKIWCSCSLYRIDDIFNNPRVACTQKLWADTITTIVTAIELERYYNEQYLLPISQGGISQEYLVQVNSNMIPFCIPGWNDLLNFSSYYDPMQTPLLNANTLDWWYNENVSLHRKGKQW